ncbi:glycosyltransferase family 4 protein [Rhodococcus sp. D-46]|jgi:glycosyltransferase involved in cell wall biosynthesis|uniref:glycosyltransferase n=1 Tax=Rhodococcus sp. D-46 TaxID=2716265 RepID=UPI0013F62D9C|nr:glycosyltransferase family 4 protein [Rhodococcus sp. D-46]
MNEPKLAIVHERFTEIAGSEHVVEQLSLTWPQATVHVPLARPAGIPSGLSSPPVTTWVDGAYRMLGRSSYAPLMPLLPSAFRGMKLGEVDAVVVSHHAFATQAAFATDAPVIAYVHSPARWAWDPAFRAQESGGVAGAAVLAALAQVARRGELKAVRRLDQVVANSTEVADRIERWWGRKAVVVHPPVDTHGFTPDFSIEREDFFLLAGRLVPYKRPDLAIRAARQAGKKLVVVGDGRWMDVCKELAAEDTVFVGRVPHDQLLDLYRRARALLMPGVEDFGIVPVEAMATGTPVIALGEGGALDTVIPGKSGLLVAPGDDAKVVGGLAEAMETFDPNDFDAKAIRAWAEGFSRKAFGENMMRTVDAVLSSR